MLYAVDISSYDTVSLENSNRDLSYKVIEVTLIYMVAILEMLITHYDVGICTAVYRVR